MKLFAGSFLLALIVSAPFAFSEDPVVGRSVVVTEYGVVAAS